MQAQRRHHVEELRDALCVLKADAPALYRYGGLGPALDLFQALSGTDRMRLIAVALLSGDDDTATVARYLAAQLDPTRESNSLGPLSEQDLSEVQEVFRAGTQCALTEAYSSAIRSVVSAAKARLGGLYLESSVWAMIQADSQAETVWLDASGGQGYPVGMKLATEFVYNPSAAARAELFTQIRKAAWTLHFHNHPNKALRPSQSDREFARYWKAQRPELSYKMRFFIVTGEAAVEYDELALEVPAPCRASFGNGVTH